MSYITRTGNLTEVPTLREGQNGPYAYARVAVSDRIRQDDGSYVDGPATYYDVAVGGARRSTSSRQPSTPATSASRSPAATESRSSRASRSAGFSTRCELTRSA